MEHPESQNPGDRIEILSSIPAFVFGTNVSFLGTLLVTRVSRIPSIAGILFSVHQNLWNRFRTRNRRVLDECRCSEGFLYGRPVDDGWNRRNPLEHPWHPLIGRLFRRSRRSTETDNEWFGARCKPPAESPGIPRIPRGILLGLMPPSSISLRAQKKRCSYFF